MNEIFNNTLVAIVYDLIHVLTLAALVTSLVVGILLIVRPSLIIQWNSRFQKSYSLRQQTRALEESHSLDHYVYRYHRLLGAIITLLSGYIFYYFSMIFHVEMFRIILSGYVSSIPGLLADWMRILMLFISTLTLIIGMAILLRPSSLKSFELWANRWISTRQAARPLNRQYQNLDQLLLNHPRTLGIFIVILSIYATLGLILIYN